MNMYFFFLGFLFMFMSLFMILLFYETLILEKIFILENSLMNLELINFKFYFYFDYMSNLFLFVVFLISMVVFFYSNYYMKGEPNNNKFMLLTFLFIFSMFLMITSLNFFMILVGWDGLGVVSYFLIIHYLSSNSEYSGMVTILTNRLGDVGMIFSLYLLVNFKTMDIFSVNFLNNFNFFLILTLTLGVMTKSAQFPFSVWLPLAMAAPTPISSLVHSSTLVTAGIYLYIRFSNIFIGNNFYFLKFLIIFCLFTSFLAGTSALSEIDIKKIIALSTLSQLSFMMMILLLGEELLSFFHILTHAMFKALLFLCSGIMIHEFLNNQDLRKFPKILEINMFIVSVFLICCLALMGFPFLSGFYSKDLILEKMYSMNMNMFILIMTMISTLLSSIYSFRLIYFSSMTGKSNLKMIFVNKWSSMYNVLIIMIFYVLITGSMLSWLLLDKISISFLMIKIKLINLLYLIFGLALFKMMNISYIKKSLYFFLTMFFMLSFQGNSFNKINYLMNYYSNQSELIIEKFLVFKITKFLKLNMINIFVLKYISIFISIIYLFMLLLLMYFS